MVRNKKIWKPAASDIAEVLPEPVHNHLADMGEQQLPENVISPGFFFEITGNLHYDKRAAAQDLQRKHNNLPHE
jgi:hypothetical protein